MVRMINFELREDTGMVIGMFKSTKSPGLYTRRISIQALVKFTDRTITWHGSEKRHLWSVR